MKYGETPWDSMTNDELKLEVFKLYKASESARSVLRILRAGDEANPFWSRGSGFSAIDQLEKAMNTVLSLDDNDREILWKGFFRNAIPLLFDDKNWDWQVCEKCEQWFCSIDKKADKCLMCGNEELRSIKWSDFYHGFSGEK